MSIQVTTRVGSLVAAGISVGDAATLVSLAPRFGNWWNASSGDAEFLKLLDGDELNIPSRRGLLDLLSFNKRWRKKMRLLANDRPITIDGKKADAVLGELSKFTAVMMCVVATLEVFTTWAVVKTLLKDVLRELLRTSEFGEDMLAAQYNQRINAWRSAACVRCLSLEAARYHQVLLENALVVPGLMPAGEARHMVDFLVWLLAGQGDVWRTSSSDVA